ncbi:TIGR04222 domain-containing membrane protein [Streptomyces antibioticus]|uniref:TIGR04222 domain-containing membrane protein n=1 Tax=Streptomyces antibioticus TaxID=1890 RepID=UPI0033CC9CAA
MFWVLLLVLAWGAAGAACARLCLAAVRAAAVGRDTDPDRRHGNAHDLTLYEAAFLSGGPGRVAELTLVSMARQRRLLLAHTGWATVVDPHGQDEMERSVIGAIGPQGQSRIAPVRAATAAADAVRSLADRLVRAGLAVPDGPRTTVTTGVRQVRGAALLVLALGTVALSMPGETGMPRWHVALWFALPLALTLGCLAIARVEVPPGARWASPAGQRLLGTLAGRADDTGTGTGTRADGSAADERAYLTSVAVLGIRAAEPHLRAAFGHREPFPRD